MKRDVFPILYARDLPALIHFYRDIIGMSETFRYPSDGEVSFVTLGWGAASVGLGTYDVTPGLEARNLNVPANGRGFELCLYVDDVDAVARRAVSDGIELLIAPVDQPWGERVGYLLDPEGNTIMLAAEAARDA